MPTLCTKMYISLKKYKCQTKCERLADERDDDGGGRDDLCEQEEEDGEREKDGDAERDLLPAVRGQVEDEHREEGDGHARDDQVDDVEERLAAHRDVERDVWVRLAVTPHHNRDVTPRPSQYQQPA